MRLILIFALLTNHNLGLSQVLKYTYPTTKLKFSINVEEVELYSRTIRNFTADMITRDYEIKNEPCQITYLLNGKIHKIMNLKDSIEFKYEYDDLGNIQLRTSNSKNYSKTFEYKLNQKEMKIETYSDGKLVEEVIFDKQNKIIYRISNHRISKGNVESKLKMTYQKENLILKEQFENDKLMWDETFEYENDMLSKSEITFKDSKRKIVKNYTYASLRKEIEKLTYLDEVQVSKSRDIEFLDEKDNLCKIYRLSYINDNVTARIEEFRFK
jgi:hypothetical protein